MEDPPPTNTEPTPQPTNTEQKLYKKEKWQTRISNYVIAAVPTTTAGKLKFLGYILVFAAVIAFLVFFSKNITKYVDTIENLGLFGNLIMIFLYYPAGLPFAFMSYYIPLSLSAGYLYGYYLGFATSMIGSVTSGVFGFWFTRQFCRNWLEEKLTASPKLAALVKAMEMNSFKVTLMLRFIFIPYGLQNGLCAMTNISYPMYFLASTVGLLPENLLLIYFGANLESISEVANGGTLPTYEIVLLCVAGVGTIVMLLVGRKMLLSTLHMAKSGNTAPESETKKKPEDLRILLRNFEEVEAEGNKFPHHDDQVELVDKSAGLRDSITISIKESTADNIGSGAVLQV